MRICEAKLNTRSSEYKAKGLYEHVQLLRKPVQLNQEARQIRLEGVEVAYCPRRAEGMFESL